MAKKAYVGVANSPKNVKTIYVGGIDGRPKKVVKGYVGDATGHPKLFWGGTVPPPPTIGKRKIEFLEDYQVGQYYNLDFADIEETVRYYVEEFEFINRGMYRYALSRSVTNKYRIFYNLINTIINDIENIVNYVLNNIGNKNEIWITSRYIYDDEDPISDYTHIVLQIYIGNSVYNNVECKRKTFYEYTLNNIYNFTETQISYDEIRITYNSDGTIKYNYFPSAITTTDVTVGQNIGYPHQNNGRAGFPLDNLTVNNVGIRFVKNNVYSGDTRRLDWKILESKLDIIDNCIIDERHVAVNNYGIQILEEGQYISIPESFTGINGYTPGWIDIDINDMNLHSEVTPQHPLNYVLFSRVSINYDSYPTGQYFLYSSALEEWILIFYINGQQYGSTIHTGISDKNYFKNSTLEVELKDTYLTISRIKDGVGTGYRITTVGPNVPAVDSHRFYTYNIGGGAANFNYTAPYNMTITRLFSWWWWQ